MAEFIAQHFIEIFFGLLSAGALAFCRYFYKQLKNYKALLEEKENALLDQSIDRHIAPIIQELERLAKRIDAVEESTTGHLELIISSYRFRLIQLCKMYLSQGYLTTEQYDQLTEFYKVYHGLGGNSQAKEYYEKAIKLPVHPAEDEQK